MTLSLGKSRIEALSDGVFAIAMTLLVLKLEVPEVMHHASNQDMLRQLLALTPAFGTYVVTFLIAGGFWFLHHLTFHFIKSVSVFLVWVNLVFLMLVALLPFSAGLMSHLLIHPVSQLFYFGNQIAIAVALNIHWLVAKHQGLIVIRPVSGPAVDEISEAGTSREVIRLSYRIATTAAAFTGAFATALFLPAYSAITLAVVLLGGVILERFQLKS